MTKLYNFINSLETNDSFLAFKIVDIKKGDNITTETIVSVEYKNQLTHLKVVDNNIIKGFRKSSKALFNISIDEDEQLVITKAGKIKGGFVSVIAETML